MIHLSILNSRILFLVIVFFTAILIIACESYYLSNEVNVTYSRDYTLKVYKSLSEGDSKYGVIIGDSRGKCGINTELLISKGKNYQFLNLCEEGTTANIMLKDFINVRKKPEIIIMAVSPADIFGFIDSNYFNSNNKSNFDFDKILSYPFKLKNPFSVSEKKINDYLQRYIRSILGFNEFTNLLFYGNISKYTTEHGWTSNIRLGSYKIYSEVINIYFYNYLLLENYKNNGLISLIKNDFQNTVEQILKSNIKIVFVRIPTSKKLNEIENYKFPWFDDYFRNIESKYKTKYITFDNYSFDETNSDGSHLTNNDALKFSNILSSSISDL